MKRAIITPIPAAEFFARRFDKGKHAIVPPVRRVEKVYPQAVTASVKVFDVLQVVIEPGARSPDDSANGLTLIEPHVKEPALDVPQHPVPDEVIQFRAFRERALDGFRPIGVRFNLLFKPLKPLDVFG